MIRTARPLLLGLAFSTAAVLAVACGDDDATSGGDAGLDAGSTGGSGGSGGTPGAHDIPDSGDPGVIMCAELGSLCHEYDTGSGLGHECHETGHLGDTAACMEIYDECIAFCQPHDEADAGDAGHSHGSEQCETLASVCHDADGGMAMECHEIGHGGDAHECESMYDACLAVCEGHHEADAGDAGDAG
jgi:hypothetical protein